MKIAKKIAEATAPNLPYMEQLIQANTGTITAMLEPVREALEKTTSCAGYIRRECLTCDEAGACVVELTSALAMLSEEE